MKSDGNPLCCQPGNIWSIRTVCDLGMSFNSHIKQISAYFYPRHIVNTADSLCQSDTEQ